MALRQGGTLYFLHSDHLGSTSLLTDASGNEAPNSRLRYFPYGSVRAGNPAALPTTFNFTGQRLDSSTQLLYYGARYYDPALGRFLSADTVVPGAGNPQALNRYSYTLNNPLGHTDPTGHRPEASVAGEPVPYEPPNLLTAGPSGIVSFAGNSALSARDMLSGVRMWQGGFRVVRNGEYASGLGKVSIYGTRASRPGGIGPTWTHAGVGNPAVARYATYGGALKSAFKSVGFWVSEALAAGIDAVDYSPIGTRSEAGYGTEFAAAVTVDVAITAVGTAAGACTMVLLPPPFGYVAGPAVAVAIPVLADGLGIRQGAISHVDSFYQGMVTEISNNPYPLWPSNFGN